MPRDQACAGGRTATGIVLGTTAGTHAGTVRNTKVQNASGNGIYVYTRSSSVLNAAFENCSSISNNASGLYLDARTASTLGGSIDDFDASGNGSYGIYSYSADSSSFTDVTFADGTVVSNGSHGVYIHDHNSSRQTIGIERVAIAGNGGHGVYCYGQYNYGATMTVSLTDATVTNNTSDGFSHYTYQGASDITLTRTANLRLRDLSSSISSLTGEAFLRGLVTCLAQNLEVDMVVVAETMSDKPGWARSVALCHGGAIRENIEYVMGSSPSADLDRQTLPRVLVEHG